MKDLSLFLVKNNLGAKMKKGFRNLCNGDGSTSTLNQHCKKSEQHFGDSSSYAVAEMVGTTRATTPPRTLEDMILQLELEEELARKEKLDDYGTRDQLIMPGRMSCVNNSDILRSARNAALNQYPRFSLDGKDAMYRSSFHHNMVPSSPPPIASTRAGPRQSSVCCRTRHNELDQVRDRFVCDYYKNSSNDTSSSMWSGTSLPLPSTIAGESVIWCKPGVVAKLMGLDAVPVPMLNYNKLHTSNNKERLSSIMKRQSLIRIAERREMERRRLLHAATSLKRGPHVRSCSKTSTTGYNCVMKRGIHVVQPVDAASGAYWPTPHFI